MQANETNKHYHKNAVPRAMTGITKKFYMFKKKTTKYSKNLIQNINFGLIFTIVSNGKKEPNWIETMISNLKTCVAIWPLHQWIFSLVALILLYALTGHYYNKWLAPAGGWLDVKTRFWLILVDLSINLILGLYYMNYRETIMGSIMMRCPIAISPAIFLLELIAIYVYYKRKKNYLNGQKSEKS